MLEIVARNTARGDITGSPESRGAQDFCNQRSPSGYSCTAVDRHTGPHVAYGLSHHVVSVWWEEQR